MPSKKLLQITIPSTEECARKEEAIEEFLRAFIRSPEEDPTSVFATTTSDGSLPRQERSPPPKTQRFLPTDFDFCTPVDSPSSTPRSCSKQEDLRNIDGPGDFSSLDSGSQHHFTSITSQRQEAQGRSESFIGRGSSGFVRLARHRSSGRLVALKEIKLTSETKQDAARRELRALCDISSAECNISSKSPERDNDQHNIPALSPHPVPPFVLPATFGRDHMINLYGAFSLEGSLFLAMEKLEGSLASIDAPFPTEILKVVAFDVLSGLHYLHSVCRIIHCDLKPNNLLYSRHGLVKISDFGSSVALSSSSVTTTEFVGSVIYMAPERLRGEEFSFASDIWALGICLAALFVNDNPFRGALPLTIQEPEEKFWALLHHIENATKSGRPIVDLPQLAIRAMERRRDNSRSFNSSGSTSLLSSGEDQIQQTTLPAPTSVTIDPVLLDFLEKCLTLRAADRPSATELLRHPFVASPSTESAVPTPGRLVLKTWIQKRILQKVKNQEGTA